MFGFDGADRLFGFPFNKRKEACRKRCRPSVCFPLCRQAVGIFTIFPRKCSWLGVSPTGARRLRSLPFRLFRLACPAGSTQACAVLAPLLPKRCQTAGGKQRGCQGSNACSRGTRRAGVFLLNFFEHDACPKQGTKAQNAPQPAGCGAFRSTKHLNLVTKFLEYAASAG